MRKQSILVVEDEPGIVDGLSYALQAEGFDVCAFSTGEQALRAVDAIQPSMAILDVGLPDMSGLELFKRLRVDHEFAVMFLTARSEEIDRVVGLELGADDYVTKPFSVREVVARVKAVLRRVGSSAGADSAHPLRVDAERQLVWYYGRRVELTRYEFGLARILAGRPGRIFGRNELLELVWDNPYASNERTVDAHVKTLRTKLKAIAPLVDPIRTQRNSGYALAEKLPVRTELVATHE